MPGLEDRFLWLKNSARSCWEAKNVHRNRVSWGEKKRASHIHGEIS